MEDKKGFTANVIASLNAQFQQVAVRNDDDRSSISGMSTWSQATSMVSVHNSHHASNKMSQRLVSVKDIQKAKKHGQFSLEIPFSFEGGLESEQVALGNAEIWINLIKGRFPELSSENFAQSTNNYANPCRVEVSIQHEDGMAANIKHCLDNGGYFNPAEHARKVTYTTELVKAACDLVVVEGWNQSLNQSRIVTVYRRQRSMADSAAKGAGFEQQVALLAASDIGAMAQDEQDERICQDRIKDMLAVGAGGGGWGGGIFAAPGDDDTKAAEHVKAIAAAILQAAQRRGIPLQSILGAAKGCGLILTSELAPRDLREFQDSVERRWGEHDWKRGHAAVLVGGDALTERKECLAAKIKAFFLSARDPRHGQASLSLRKLV